MPIHCMYRRVHGQFRWVGAAHSLLYECDENVSAVFGEVALSGQVCECQNWSVHLMNWLEALVFTLRERRILQSVMRDTHASHDAPSGAQPAPGSHSAAGQCALPHTPAAPPHLRGEVSQQTTHTLVTNNTFSDIHCKFCSCRVSDPELETYLVSLPLLPSALGMRSPSNTRPP